MKQPIFIIAAIAIGIIVLGFYFANRITPKVSETLSPSPNATAEVSDELNVDTSERDEPSNPTPSSQTNKPSTSPTESANITVSHPKNSQTVSDQFVVNGQARVFENVLNMRVTNAQTAQVLVNKHTMANSPDVGLFGDYNFLVDLSSFNLKNGTKLLLEVFSLSAKDGSEINKVSIPLVYQK
jgi:cytoskeletal protein RodZ